MKRLVAVLLCVLVMLPSSVWSQTIPVSLVDLTLLRTSLTIAESSLKTITTEVVALRTQLLEAKDSQKNSETITEDSKLKINDLELRLETALQELTRLEKLVQLLQTQYQQALILLANMRKDTEKMKKDHTQAVLDLSQKYQTQIVIRNIAIVTLIVIVVAEAIFIGVQAFNK